MAKEIIQPGSMYRTAGYAHAVRAGDTIYISGHIARDGTGALVSGDIERQADQVFRNIREVLNSAGADMDALVKMNIYAMSPEYRSTILSVRDRYCTPGTFASTFIVPQALASPDLLLEIEAIAYVGD